MKQTLKSKGRKNSRKYEEKTENDAAEEWSTAVNWKEDQPLRQNREVLF